MQLIQGSNAINFPFIQAMKTSLRKFKIFDLYHWRITLFLLYSFPNGCHEAKLQACGRGQCIHQPNCQNVLRSNSGDKIIVIKNQIHAITPVSDSCWWGGPKLPESFPRPGPDCHRGQRRAEEENHPEPVARWRGRGVVKVTCAIRCREYTHITRKTNLPYNTFAK